MCTRPILQYPDFKKPFTVTTDASDYAIGAVLSQENGHDLPIAYLSRMLLKPEQNYSTTEKECLAILYAILHFRPYLYGRKFTLVSDHEPLRWINSINDPGQRLVRWRLKLRDYEYEFVHKSGKLNTNADALSRNPVNEILTESTDDSDEGTNLEKKQLLPLKESEKTSESPTPSVAQSKPVSQSKIPKPGKTLGSRTTVKRPTILDQSAIATRTRSKLPLATKQSIPGPSKLSEPPGMAITEPTISLETLNPSTSLHEGSSTDDPPILRQRKSVFPNLEYYPETGILENPSVPEEDTAVAVNPSEARDIMVDVPETHDVSVFDKTPDFSIELKDLLECFKRFDESMQERGVSFVDDEEDPIEFQEDTVAGEIVSEPVETISGESDSSDDEAEEDAVRNRHIEDLITKFERHIFY